MTVTSIRTYFVSWIALLLLLALTLGSSYLHLGTFNLVANLAIAVAKALIVMTVYMHLKRSSPLIRLIAAAGFFWLAILTALSLTDLLTPR